MISNKHDGNPFLVDLVFLVHNVNVDFTCDIADNFCLTLLVMFYFDK